MRGTDRLLYRLVLVLALGAGLAALAMQPEKPKVAVRDQPAPIILAVAQESASPAADTGARVDRCSLNPRDYADDRPIGETASNDVKKKKVIVCG